MVQLLRDNDVAFVLSFHLEVCSLCWCAQATSVQAWGARGGKSLWAAELMKAWLLALLTVLVSISSHLHLNDMGQDQWYSAVFTNSSSNMTTNTLLNPEWVL